MKAKYAIGPDNRVLFTTTGSYQQINHLVSSLNKMKPYAKELFLNAGYGRSCDDILHAIKTNSLGVLVSMNETNSSDVKIESINSNEIVIIEHASWDVLLPTSDSTGTTQIVLR